jgi:predicted RNA-binding protein with PIN domain
MIIIDGNNLIHQISEYKKIFKENPSAIQSALIEKVKSGYKTKEKIIFVFDGFGELDYKNIIFAGAISADEVIRKIIEEKYQKETLTIVSSDYGITNLAKMCSCNVVNSKDFIKRIDNKGSLKNKNINQLLREDKTEKPGGMSKKDFNEFKKYFT